MFKIKCLAFLFCLISTVAIAKPFKVDRELICDDIGEALKMLPEFNEEIVWQGKNEKGLINILTLNPQTQTWSMLVTDGKTVCLLDFGKGFQVEKRNSPPPKTEKNNLKYI